MKHKGEQNNQEKKKKFFVAVVFKSFLVGWSLFVDDE